MCCLTGIHSEKCVVRGFHHCANVKVRLHRPRWYGLLHTSASWHGLLLLGYKPVKHVTVPNNMRLNQVQEKMMQSRDSKHEMYEAADSIALHTILQQIISISRNSIL